MRHRYYLSAWPAIALLLMSTSTGLSGKTQPRHRIEIVQSRVPGPPVVAIVSLHRQQITIYDTAGWTLRAPVSSGRNGYETPAGLYTVIQKEAEHYSNLYEDGYMPFMQRITWSGIALHGGPLPGYPASHGCVRMPLDFAERLFDLTKLGMRVVVAREDPSPLDITHPFLLELNPILGANAAAIKAAGSGDSSSKVLNPAAQDSATATGESAMRTVQSIAREKREAAAEAARKADAARLVAVQTTTQAARITFAMRSAELQKTRAEEQLAIAQSALEAARTAEEAERAQASKARAVERLAEVEARLANATAAAQNKPDVAQAREEARRAEVERSAAVEAADEAAHKAVPVSIFISRKTQRLYARQSFQPVFEAPVEIRDPDQPIGTHLFPALEYTNGGHAIRWSAISMQNEGTSSLGPAAALDRISIPSGVLAQVAEITSPGSSLIISDEALSSETASDTDFIVVMSGEPHGALARRHRSPDRPVRYTNPYQFRYSNPSHFQYTNPYQYFWR